MQFAQISNPGSSGEFRSNTRTPAPESLTEPKQAKHIAIFSSLGTVSSIRLNFMGNGLFGETCILEDTGDFIAQPVP